MDEPTTPAPKRKRNARAGKPPAFPFYAADWLADKEVRKMSHAERGIYIDLLAYSWREHGLDADPEENRILLRIRRGPMWIRAWTRITARFPLVDACGCGSSHPGKLFNERLEKERKAQREFKEQQRDRSGMRWHTTGIHPAVPEPSLSSASSLASAVGGRAESGTRDGELPLTETLPPNGDAAMRKVDLLVRWHAEFAALWKNHPPRRGTKANKPKAWEAYRALRPGLELAGMIQAGHGRAIASESWVQGFVPDLHRWLKAKGWEDEHGVMAAPGWEKTFLAKGETDGEGD